jgi:quercetin dioxygenase-like cupin family protein
MTDIPNNLSPIKRYITSHESSGKSVFSTSISEDVPSTAITGAAFSLAYTSQNFPVDLNSEADISSYSTHLQEPPGISLGNGTVLRYVDFCPEAVAPMHRTLSLDYGVVIEGEVEAVLDSGEVKVLKRGDVLVQRGTLHAWRNKSKTDWARMLFVLIGAKPVLVDGKELGEVHMGQGPKLSD